jgi:hypothetical protein
LRNLYFGKASGVSNGAYLSILKAQKVRYE